MAVTFDQINTGSGPTGSISAIALDGNTASAAISGDRNYHIGSRYGLTFLTNFMSGLSSAITSNASTTTTTTSDSSTTTTSSASSYDWEEYFLTGLGAAGTAMSDNLNDQLQDVPTLTVTIPAGELIGVLLTSDFKLQTS